MKKLIAKIISLPDRCYNKFILWYRKVIYDATLQINGRIKVFGHGRIEIGRDVIINSSLSSNPIGGDTRTILSLKNAAKLHIGNQVGMSNVAIVCHDEIWIGDRTIIGGGTKIYDTNFHSLEATERGDYLNENVVAKAVMIEEDVFIGAHCIILKGVSIGARSIVGAGSVVTKSIPADEVWGGNPAKCIRKKS